MWVGDRCERTYSGHTDAVRSLALVSGIGFLSASNDGTVRMWELAGTCLQVLQASESFVYSVVLLPYALAHRTKGRAMGSARVPPAPCCSLSAHGLPVSLSGGAGAASG